MFRRWVLKKSVTSIMIGFSVALSASVGFCSQDSVRSDQFVSAKKSTLQSYLNRDKTIVPIDVELAKGITKGDQSPLLVSLRRPFVTLKSAPASLQETLSGADSNKSAMESYLRAIYAGALPDSVQGADILQEFKFVANFTHGMKGHNSEADFKGEDREPSQKTESIYWTAMIPKNARVTNSSLQIETFPDGLGKHMQHQITLDQPILLFPPSVEGHAEALSWREPLDLRGMDRYKDAFNLPTDRPVLIRGELIYALMGFRFYEGPESFSFVNGITGNLVTGYVLTSVSQMALDQLTRGSYIRRYELPFNEVGKQAIFDYMLNHNQPVPASEVNSYRLPSIYNTVYYNCITEALNVINVGLKASGMSEIDSYQFNPFAVPENLLANHVISEDHRVILNEIYPEIAKSQVEKKIKAIEDLKVVVQSQAFDTFVRQFANETAKNKWTANEINAFASLVSKRVSLALVSVEWAVESELKSKHPSKSTQAILNDFNTPDKQQRLLQIAQVIDGLLVQTDEDGGEEAVKAIRDWIVSSFASLRASQ